MDLGATSESSVILPDDLVGESRAELCEASLAILLEIEDSIASGSNGFGSACAAELGDDSRYLLTCNLALDTLEAFDRLNCGKIIFGNRAEVEISIPVVVAIVIENIILVIVPVVSILDLPLF